MPGPRLQVDDEGMQLIGWQGLSRMYILNWKVPITQRNKTSQEKMALENRSKKKQHHH